MHLKLGKLQFHKRVKLCQVGHFNVKRWFKELYTTKKDLLTHVK